MAGRPFPFDLEAINGLNLDPGGPRMSPAARRDFIAFRTGGRGNNMADADSDHRALATCRAITQSLRSR
eukprot:7956934-Alexandrium_andersonii.AAC.1